MPHTLTDFEREKARLARRIIARGLSTATSRTLRQRPPAALRRILRRAENRTTTKQEPTNAD